MVSQHPKLVCPRGDFGLIISTLHLYCNLAVNTESMTITAELGVRLWQLIHSTAQRGMEFNLASKTLSQLFRKR